jgi:tellurite methyltransferase
MGNIEKFYENTKNGMPHDNIKKFIEMNTRNGNAIDLGCGAGRDTIFLIKNNWNVIAIDREDTKDIIEISLNAEELKKFKFVQQNFENIQLDKNDLIVSNFSIPFCNKNHFNDFWLKIVNSINSNRILCR